jgi:hypothetical protein
VPDRKSQIFNKTGETENNYSLIIYGPVAFFHPFPPYPVCFGFFDAISPFHGYNSPVDLADLRLKG